MVEGAAASSHDRGVQSKRLAAEDRRAGGRYRHGGDRYRHDAVDAEAADRRCNRMACGVDFGLAQFRPAGTSHLPHRELVFRDARRHSCGVVQHPQQHGRRKPQPSGLKLVDRSRDYSWVGGILGRGLHGDGHALGHGTRRKHQHYRPAGERQGASSGADGGAGRAGCGFLPASGNRKPEKQYGNCSVQRGLEPREPKKMTGHVGTSQLSRFRNLLPLGHWRATRRRAPGLIASELRVN